MNKIKSVMFGHAIGDALGVPVEFLNRKILDRNPVVDMMGFGTHNMPTGCWSDDTSMALCALESLANGIVNYDDIMSNFGKWYYDEEFTATNEVFDIGGTCYNAIRNYVEKNHDIHHCGINNINANGNGSLMRIHPFVLYCYYNNISGDEFDNIIATGSALTHAHECSISGCVLYAYVLKELLDNPSKVAIYNGISKAKERIGGNARYYDRLINHDIAKFSRNDIKSSGYVVDTLEAAIWCLLTTESYKDCVLKAVNLGEDTDTVAAIAGGLAGALYGMNGIPNYWINKLLKADYIEDMCEKAYEKWR
jgi:ADP-ribosylglycohydrolase